MKNNPTNITSEGASKKLVPELRFPEFVNEGEWTENVFGELFTYLPNNTLSRAELTDKREDVQNIHYGDILIKFPNVLDAQKELLPSISDVEQIRNIETSRLRDGDVVIADTAEDEAVGKCTEIVNVGDSRIVSGLHTIPCRPNITFTKGYLGHYMNSNAFHYRLRPLMQGAKVTSISKTALKNVTLTFPHSIAEQQKIAQCLSSLDELIAATKEKVELLKEHKRGLMQKLFPAKGKNLPELRFPEFKEEGIWDEYTLGEITNVVNRRNKSNRSLPVFSISNKGGFISQSEQFDGLDSNRRGYDISMYKLVGKNTFAYNPARINVGSIGYSGDLKEVIISSLYVCFKTTEKIEDDFLSCFTNTILFRQAVDNNVEGGIRSYLFYENFSKIKIWLPTIPEQKKITLLFQSIDDMIDNYSLYLEYLELHKKGLMQKIFPKIR